MKRVEYTLSHNVVNAEELCFKLHGIVPNFSLIKIKHAGMETTGRSYAENQSQIWIPKALTSVCSVLIDVFKSSSASSELHCKFKKVVLTRGSHFNTIRRVIFTPPMCHFDFNRRFDSDVGSK